MLVVYTNLSSLEVYSLSPDVLILVCHLVGMRIELAVRSDNAIAVEVVVRRVVVVVVTTIGVLNLVVLSVCEVVLYRHRLNRVAVQRLVNEVPDISSLELRILTYHIPIFLEATAGVTHGMVVLALYEWACELVVLRIFVATVVAIVHRAEDVGILTRASSLLELYGTALVLLLNPLVCSNEVVAVYRLVAERPYDNRRMVEVHLHIVLVALEYLLGKLRLLGLGVVAVAKAVALLVGLSGNV